MIVMLNSYISYSPTLMHNKFWNIKFCFKILRQNQAVTDQIKQIYLFSAILLYCVPGGFQTLIVEQTHSILHFRNDISMELKLS